MQVRLRVPGSRATCGIRTGVGGRGSRVGGRGSGVGGRRSEVGGRLSGVGGRGYNNIPMYIPTCTCIHILVLVLVFIGRHTPRTSTSHRGTCIYMRDYEPRLSLPRTGPRDYGYFADTQTDTHTHTRTRTHARTHHFKHSEQTEFVIGDLVSPTRKDCTACTGTYLRTFAWTHRHADMQTHYKRIDTQT